MDWIDIAIIIAKTLVVFLLLNVLLAIVVWAERKILSDMQSRIGPNQAGPFGILQSLADGVKLLMKEDILPTAADKIVYRWRRSRRPCPLSSLSPSSLSATRSLIGGREIVLQLADINVGILFFLAMGSMAVYGIALAGWSSGSKYPLIGAVRSSAQMISYEIAMGLSVVPVILYAGTMSTRGIVEAQAGRVVHRSRRSRRF